MIIYLITNILNGKRYVGQTTRTLEQRVKEHQATNSGVGKAINQCGVENFRFEVLETCDTIDQLNEREKFWISKLNCIAPNGYNRNDGGRNFIRIPRSKSIVTVLPSRGQVTEQMTTGELIAYTRESKGVLQKDLAKAINIDPVVLNRIEKGKRPARGDEIKAIADYFNVSTDYLLGRRKSDYSVPLSDEQTIFLKSFDKLSDISKQAIMSLIGQLTGGQSIAGGVVKGNITGNKGYVNVGGVHMTGSAI